MGLKEHYREMTTCIMILDNNKEICRRPERRRVYIDRKGYRFIRSYGFEYPLNADNEWRQPISHIVR